MWIKLKGTSFYQENIEYLESRTAIFSPEPYNPHDNFAMAVQSEGRTIGYLPRGWQEEKWGERVVQILKEGEAVIPFQVIGGFYISQEERAYFGVDISI